MNTLERLEAACWRFANPTGPQGRARALTDIRELARQLDQEDPCQNLSTTHSDRSSTSPNASSSAQSKTSTPPDDSGSASRTTSSRSRTIKTTPAPSRRRTP